MSANSIKGTSLKTKIILTLVGLSLVALAAVSTIVGLKIHKELTQQARHQLSNTVIQKSEEYNLIFKRLSDEVEAVAVFSSQLLQRKEALTDVGHRVLLPWVGKGIGEGYSKGYGSPELVSKFSEKSKRVQRIGNLLAALVKKNDNIAGGYFATADGLFVSDTNKSIFDLLELEAYIPAKRSWYKLALEKRKTSWSEPYVGASLKKLMVTVATPVYDNKRNLLGVVGLDVLLEKIEKDILQIDTGFDGYSLLINSDGKALVSPVEKNQDLEWNIEYSAENLMKTDNKSWNTVISKMFTGFTGIGEFEDNGTNYLAYAPIAALDAKLGLVVSEKSVVSPAIDILKWILGVAAAISLLAIFVGIYFGNSISKPILELTDLVNEASTGKSKLITLTSIRTDEIGLLSDAYNRLIKSLTISMELNKKLSK